MWLEVLDQFRGVNVFMNIFTREKVDAIELYDGIGLKKKKDIWKQLMNVTIILLK
jgi:hypothetical protein